MTDNLSTSAKKNYQYAIVASRFNKPVMDLILENTLHAFRDENVSKDHIDVLRVPGAYEIPQTLSLLAKKKKYDAMIALGCIIRGETYHFECIADYVASHIGQISISNDIPVIFGILTTNTLRQALDRVEQGRDYALNAIEMAHLFNDNSKPIDSV